MNPGGFAPDSTRRFALEGKPLGTCSFLTKDVPDRVQRCWRKWFRFLKGLVVLGRLFLGSARLRVGLEGGCVWEITVGSGSS